MLAIKMVNFISIEHKLSSMHVSLLGRINMHLCPLYKEPACCSHYGHLVIDIIAFNFHVNTRELQLRHVMTFARYQKNGSVISAIYYVLCK